MYFLDTGLGSGWWMMDLYLALLFAVMVVRGKPYGAEQTVTVLFPKRVCCSAWLGPLLAFTWNVVLPIALLIMAVVTFKTGMVAEMFNWSLTEGYIYLPSWVREIGSMMQVMPLLVIPFVGIIQSCRYFLHGPDNLLEVSQVWLQFKCVTRCTCYCHNNVKPLFFYCLVIIYLCRWLLALTTF